MKIVINPQDCPTGITPIDLETLDSVPDKKSRVWLKLLFLQEYSALVYKAECAAKEYCVEPFAKAHNAYYKQAEALRENILSEVLP